MKQLLRSALFLLLTLATALNASATWVSVNHNSINYTFYYSGSGGSAVGDSAVVTGPSSDFSGAANISSSVTYKYTYVSGYDSQGNAIYTTRNLTASVIAINYMAFYDCTALTSVTIPNSVKTIGKSAFDGCSNLTSVTIPNSVTTIPYSCFSKCSSLTRVTIPNSVTKISDGCFLGCSGLTSVTIPNSVTTIGIMAFFFCTSLESVTIGNSVTKIGQQAFAECSLTSITCLAETPPIAFSGSISAFNDFSATLHVPAGSLYEYQTTWPWSRFYNIQPIGQEYSISLSPTSAVIEKGDFIELEATVTPDDDYAPRVTWSSSNSAVATVDEWGIVTAVGAGNAVITAHAGDASATCSIKVVAHTVTLDKSSASIPLYSTLQLNATVTPHDGYEPTVTWSSSHPGVATVNQDGLVKGYMTGTATITARAGQSTATCVVTVTPILATELALNAYQTEIGVGDIFRLVATVYPDNATNRTVSWTIPPTDVISYSCNGNECLFVGENAGQVIITARTTDGTNLSKSCVVTVKGSEPVFIPVQSISVSPSSVRMTVGATRQLTATVLPTNATNRAVSWTSSNTSVVTVGSDGRITALKTGTATVTAHAKDGTGVSGSCTVTVVAGGGSERLPGDVNGDGEVNISDVIRLINAVLNEDFTGIDMDNADVNGDGVVNISDVVALISNLTNGAYEVLPGDANGDGVINISDAISLINALLNEDFTGINMDNADMNGDGVVNISDVTALIGYLNGNVGMFSGAAADVNGDGKVNLSDALILLNRYFDVKVGIAVDNDSKSLQIHK